MQLRHLSKYFAALKGSDRCIYQNDHLTYSTVSLVSFENVFVSPLNELPVKSLHVTSALCATSYLGD